MLHVRFHVAKPAERLVASLEARLQEYNVRLWLNILVDDAAVVVQGRTDAIAKCLRKTCRDLFDWVKEELGKQIATKKTQCVVSSIQLKAAVEKQMRTLSVPVTLHGDMLGVDCAVGGHMGKKQIHSKGSNKANRRTRTIR